MSGKIKKAQALGSRQEVERLFAVAKQNAVTDPKLAQRCVEIARKIASKSRISLRKYNRLCCRKCSAYFTSKTLRVRTNPSSVSYSCLSCGDVTRIRKK